ncbi:MAG TPA: acetate kinase [Haloplasmataceae bacterium]
MKKVLAINAGSSTLKYKLFAMPEEAVLTEGKVDRIGKPDAEFTIYVNGEKKRQAVKAQTAKDAVQIVLTALVNEGIINSLDEIEGVGHRVVHGGEYFKDSTVIDESVIEKIDGLSALAPLHNPANLQGILAFRDALPHVTNVAVFDTSFHQSMPPESYLYAVPMEWYRKYHVRKYGFHGISHKYVSQRVQELLGNPKAKVIVCHLGSGASICAVDGDRSVDTTMGFGPLAGLVMGTRSGDIDPTIIPYIMKQTGKTIEDVEYDLNYRSGFLGVSEHSNDSRDIEEGIEKGHAGCRLAQNLFNRRVVSYIASYHALLNGADAIAFTAGIGENSPQTRKEVIEALAVFGFKLDEKRNDVYGKERLISSDDSSIPIYVIPTNEEIMIARDVMRFL